MFELKYKITDADMKAVNKGMMWRYFIIYAAVALLGIGAGIAAITAIDRTEMFVLGIILIVLASILLVCAILMAIAPKNFVASALLTGDTERTLSINDDGITVKTPEQSDITIGYFEITKVKDKKTHALLYVGKDVVLLVKDAIVSGGTFPELVELLNSKVEPKAPKQTPIAGNNAAEAKDEIKEEPEIAEQKDEAAEEKAETAEQEVEIGEKSEESSAE